MTQRAAIYVRQSQTHDETISPVLQRQKATEFAHSQGWTVLEAVYEDIDISGRKMDNRPGLKALRAAYERGEFDIAVAYDLSRFSRTLEDGAGIISDMRVATFKEGVADEDDDFTPLLHMLLSHKFSRDMGKRWKEVHNYRALKGIHPTGQPQFGYDKQPDGTYIPNDYAPVLKKAYEDYIGGKSFKDIAVEFNERGIPTLSDRSEEWSYTAVIGLMCKKFPTGVIEFRGEEFPGAHEPIISPEMYSAFTARRNQNAKRAPRNKYPEWPLSGLIECGSCGGRVGQIQRFRDGRTRLGCLNRRNKGNCEQRAIYRRQADWALTLFLSQYQETILSALPDAQKKSELEEAVKSAQYALTAAEEKLKNFISTVAELGLTLTESKDVLAQRRSDVESAQEALRAAEDELVLAVPVNDLEDKEDLSPSEWALLLRTKLIDRCVLEPDQSFSIHGFNGHSVNQKKMSFNGEAVTKKPTTQGLSREETRQARKWLRSQGHPVSVRGNIKFEFLKLWNEAGRPEA